MAHVVALRSVQPRDLMSVPVASQQPGPGDDEGKARDDRPGQLTEPEQVTAALSARLDIPGVVAEAHP